jgi:hypothetical protein
MLFFGFECSAALQLVMAAGQVHHWQVMQGPK